MVLFSVTDTGIGIPEEKQDVVFERFVKLSEYSQGSGLGLAICKLVTHKLGGDIWIDTDYTKGTRFIFSHPLPQATPEETETQDTEQTQNTRKTLV
jgi:signal transduction histidine kinase